MKFLLVSDLHYALKQYDWTTAVAPDFDAVVIAGDHLDISGHVDGSVQILVILKYLKRLLTRSKLVVSSGNHDLDVRNAAGEKIAHWMNKVREMGIPTDGDTVAFGSSLVTICPWWDGPNSKQAVQAQIERDASKDKDLWIWVYHAPPEGSPTSWDGKRFYGDVELLDWINAYKPDIVLTGHIHQAPFTDQGSWADKVGSTWIFNSGRQIGPMPTHVIVNTETREAVWISMQAAEIVRLDEPLRRPFTPLTAAPAWLDVKIRDPGPSPV